MKLIDFDFELPKELIAQYPPDKRDSSNLLVTTTPITKTKFYNIVDYFKNGDLLVLNNSRVIKAKLHLGGNITINLNKQLSSHCWSAFANPSRKLHIGDEFYFNEHKLIISEKLEMGEVKITFELNNISVFDFLDKYGKMPIPPYIKRLSSIECNADILRYQTIYSALNGSVAAPTAGLHFTDEILDVLKNKGVQIVFVTLHVGAGTFLPVKAENINNHKMHTEYYSITIQASAAINKAKQEGRRIIAVGTTSLRALESSCINGLVQAQKFETDIFITPGFKFQIVDMLLTNFHFPKSTLFMLVCAFAGFNEMHELYKYAIAEKMRFFSYGDATLLYKKT